MDRNAERMKVGGIDVASLSARRAWIEMCARLCTYMHKYVALRKESVDRNAQRRGPSAGVCVALRKESVDRNNVKCARHIDVQASLSARRAWIEMSAICCRAVVSLSLSARRAWIEIFGPVIISTGRAVSLSARRAWIEIPVFLSIHT